MHNDTRNPKKEIHIVFQVLNFLHSDHHLAKITTAAEHLLLINLASHRGKKGICPSISLITRELKLTRMTVIRSIQRWEELEVLQIQKDIGKRNYYFLLIPSPSSNIGDTSSTYVTSNIGETGLVTFTTPTSNIGETGIYNKEELSNNKKAFMQKAENEKRHDFAKSKDQMASEKKHIEEHEKTKYAPMPDEVKIKCGLMRKPDDRH